MLVLPGLMASDVSTRALRAWLRRLRYPVAGWALGRNRGPAEEVVSELPLLVDRLAQPRHEWRPFQRPTRFGLGTLFPPED